MWSNVTTSVQLLWLNQKSTSMFVFVFFYVVWKSSLHSVYLFPSYRASHGLQAASEWCSSYRLSVSFSTFLHNINLCRPLSGVFCMAVVIILVLLESFWNKSPVIFQCLFFCVAHHLECFEWTDLHLYNLWLHNFQIIL